MAFSFRSSGSFKNNTKFLEQVQETNFLIAIHKYGALGVTALSSMTPVDSGTTAAAWDYDFIQTKTGLRLEFFNSNVNKGVPIAIILQYGHGTGTGGYIQGRDYINPAIQPVFDKIVDSLWDEVKSL